MIILSTILIRELSLIHKRRMYLNYIFILLHCNRCTAKMAFTVQIMLFISHKNCTKQSERRFKHFKVIGYYFDVFFLLTLFKHLLLFKLY